MRFTVTNFRRLKGDYELREKHKIERRRSIQKAAADEEAASVPLKLEEGKFVDLTVEAKVDAAVFAASASSTVARDDVSRTPETLCSLLSKDWTTRHGVAWHQGDGID